MKTDKHISFGKEGEEIAANFLIKKGWQVLFKNVRARFGEVDIICRAQNGTLVFVEVKAMSGTGVFKPEDHLTAGKLKKLSRMCQMFSAKHPELIREDMGWRMDLVALTKDNKSVVINHYDNIA